MMFCAGEYICFSPKKKIKILAIVRQPYNRDQLQGHRMLSLELEICFLEVRPERELVVFPR